MKTPVNLAARPFRNEAGPNLLFAAGVVAAGMLTVRHVVLLGTLVGESASTLNRRVAGLEAEVRQTRQAAQAVRGPAPNPATLAEWRAVQDLVDRRVFSWGDLLARLETALPAGVRLTTIEPSVVRGKLTVQLVAVARTREEGFEVIKALEAAGGFNDVSPLSINTTPRGEEFTYTMGYRGAQPRGGS